MKKKGRIFLLLCIIFCSCSKDDDFQSVLDNNRILLDSTYTLSRDLYLWNDQMMQNGFNPLQFKTPTEILVEFRRYSPKNDQGIPIDKWSFAIDKESWGNMLDGNVTDFGCSFRFKDIEDLRISSVQENSFAGKNGLYRGLQVLSINGIKCTSTNIDLLSTELNKSSYLSILYIDKKTQSNKNIIISKTPYIINPIIANKYFNVDNNKVGYINVSTFISSINNKLPYIFNDFKNETINTLIIDLRYNGGGLTSVMEEIANLLIPPEAIGKIMYKTRHNSNYSMFDSNTLFLESSQRLNLKTVYFIVSQNTASSSEMLINAIKPYLNTVLIGQETHGKLVGMYTVPFHNYILAPVSFKTYNANNESLEKNGFTPNYYVKDDVENDFNENEASIAVALYHYKNHSFPNAKKQSKITTKNKISLPNDILTFAIKNKDF